MIYRQSVEYSAGNWYVIKPANNYAPSKDASSIIRVSELLLYFSDSSDCNNDSYTYCNDALLRTAECLCHIQVTESMISPETRERELTPLKKIPDNYEKIVIAMNAGLEQDQEGIKIVSAIDFLLEE